MLLKNIFAKLTGKAFFIFKCKNNFKVCFKVNVSGYVFFCRIHYPGSYSPGPALRTDRPLWASEDFSCQNNVAGGGCWARVSETGWGNWVGVGMGRCWTWVSDTWWGNWVGVGMGGF